MLVLRRKQGEGIVLDGVVKIHILSIEGDRVKVGIDAPPDVIIVRDELLDEEHLARRAAAKAVVIAREE